MNPVEAHLLAVLAIVIIAVITMAMAVVVILVLAGLGWLARRINWSWPAEADKIVTLTIVSVLLFGSIVLAVWGVHAIAVSIEHGHFWDDFWGRAHD